MPEEKLRSLQFLLSVETDKKLVPLTAEFNEVGRPLDAGRWIAPTLAAPGADPNDLGLQRWAVVVTNDNDGKSLLEATETLIKSRAEEQGLSFEDVILRVEPRLSAEQAFRWKLETYLTIPEPERPRYLMILGDFSGISLDFQRVMSDRSFVGRVAFDEPSDYKAYAEKVIESEKRDDSGRKTAPRMLFLSTGDGTQAITSGQQFLIDPGREMCTRWKGDGAFNARSIDFETTQSIDDFYFAINAEDPSVLLSMSHGYGVDTDAKNQRAQQGALIFTDKQRLIADAIKSGDFLPEGIWVFFACFSAGTPKNSMYTPWMNSSAIEAYLAKDSAFVASLPKAVLANPKGPLAVIGHVDLAWSVSYSTIRQTSRAQRFVEMLRTLCHGHRVGVGLDVLHQYFRQSNYQLTADFALETNAKRSGQKYQIDSTTRRWTWMLRNDLINFILLGDPAARLPLKGPASNQRNTPRRQYSHQVKDREKMVLNILTKKATVKALASMKGICPTTLQHWVAVYQSAGRQALESDALVTDSEE